MVKLKLILKLPAGKTAPRLIDNILRYDPLHPHPAGHNLLIDPVPVVDTRQKPLEDTAQGACHHKLVIKSAQSKLPPKEGRPNSSIHSVLAAYCTHCRIHFTVRINNPQACPNQDTCPKQGSPLHHFRYHPSGSNVRASQLSNGSRVEDWEESHLFECSSRTCSAVVSIIIKSPRLRPGHLHSLIDPVAIRSRVQAEINANPERLKDSVIPTPIKVMATLKAYLTDAIRSDERKKVNSGNKRFLTTLGEGTADLLQYLGFKYVEDPESDDLPQYWDLPEIHKSDEGPELQDDQSCLVDDVEKELIALIGQKTHVSTGPDQKAVSSKTSASIKELERLLGCSDYDKLAVSRRTIDLMAPEFPYFASLGALADFSDDLIIFAYERQRICDPDRAPYYLDCLNEIALKRNSEALQTKAVLMESAGEVSRKAILEAYGYFGIDPRSTDLSDEYIIGCYQSRAEASPLQIEAARQQLRVIGVARHSNAIDSVASNRMMTYENALVWLGAEEGTPDDFIVSLLSTRIAENQQDKEMCRTAASLIAEKRNSYILRSWLSTASSGEVGMDIGRAYTRLGIEDRTVDDDLIITTFEIRASELPEQGDELRAALAAIGREKNSQKIREYLRTGMMTESIAHDWPVGLENIGNTCYLNSLLQFYFTVRPLRDLVLNFQEYEETTSPENLKRKRVGSRKVTVKEIERAKKFAYELRKLFQDLIAAQSSAIRPARELARLTLIKSSDEEDFRRRSTVGQQDRPRLGDLNGTAIQGARNVLPVNADVPDSTMEIDPRGGGSHDTAIELEPTDEGSEKTLIDDPPPYDDPDQDIVMTNVDTVPPLANVEPIQHSNIITVAPVQRSQLSKIPEDKENVPLSKIGETTSQGSSSGSSSDPQKTTAEPHLNEQDSWTSLPKPIADGRLPCATTINEPLTPPSDNEFGLAPPPPDHAPPIPPRPKHASPAKPVVSTPNLIDELELGAQQDVTEVIGNVLFQLECAMRATGHDLSTGEQTDEIKALFYGRNKAHILARDGPRINEEYFADIKINVADGPKDIYEALDGAFDVQTISLEDGEVEQYTSISALPPILQIHVQRVQYDKVKGKMYKSDSKLGLRERIFMDRYLETGNTARDDRVLARRREGWKWKQQIVELKERRDMLASTEMVSLGVVNVLEMTETWLNQVGEEMGVDGEEDRQMLLEELRRTAERVKRELEEIDARIHTLQDLFDHQFAGLQSFPYRLQSVFIHRGTATFGHYWIYIHDFTSTPSVRLPSISQASLLHQTASTSSAGLPSVTSPYISGEMLPSSLLSATATAHPTHIIENPTASPSASSQSLFQHSSQPSRAGTNSTAASGLIFTHPSTNSSLISGPSPSPPDCPPPGMSPNITGRWLKYNDAYITGVAPHDVESEIYSQDDRYPATPYYLVYVREDMIGELCESICRDPGSTRRATNEGTAINIVHCRPSSQEQEAGGSFDAHGFYRSDTSSGPRGGHPDAVNGADLHDGEEWDGLKDAKIMDEAIGWGGINTSHEEAMEGIETVSNPPAYQTPSAPQSSGQTHDKLIGGEEEGLPLSEHKGVTW